eukprot:TRINITY_DN129_c4_g1_i1.p6 TRINITY_DN129_c4_g1~~TRINITY_DN129_c4_g1_i1.p6  ORF type:complete len:283 (+),score=36.44 TRINITY_DN129_c4_g1_i1:5915-6763(+)
MEQYMYTYLNQQFGIKSLIQEWANAITEGIAKYYTTDPDVFLFGKVLHSEIDEGFIQAVYEFKSHIKESLREILKNEFKYKSELDILQYMDGLYSGTELMEEWIWQAILLKVMPPSETSQLVAKIKEASVDNAITMNELQNILLNHKIIQHAKRIEKFAELFKKVDSDKNGIVNQEELKGMLSQMKVNKVNMDKIVKAVDPHDTQQITFSECFKTISAVLLIIVKSQQGVNKKGGMSIIDQLNKLEQTVICYCVLKVIRSVKRLMRAIHNLILIKVLLYAKG